MPDLLPVPDLSADPGDGLAAARLPAAADGGARARARRRRHRVDLAAGLRQLRHGRLRRDPRRRGHRLRGRRPVHLPVVGEIGAGQGGLMALSPGTAAKIMTGAPVPAGCDAIVPYEWTDRGVAQVRITRAPEPGPARPLRRRGRRRGRPAARARHRPRAAPPRPARRRRPRHRAVPPAPAGRRHLHRLRAARARHAAGSRLDLRRQLLPPGRLRARRRRHRLPRRHRPRRPAHLHRRPSDQLVRADIVVTSGGVSEGDFDVVKEALSSLGSVWFGGVAMQPGKPQGFGTVGDDKHPDLHAARQPGLGLRLLRDLRAAGDPPDDGQAALLAAAHAGPASRTPSRRRPAASRWCARPGTPTAAARS